MVKLLTILLILFSCSSHDRHINNDISKNDTLNTNYSTKGDSLIIPSFEIEVGLSQKADKKLKDDKETIIVRALFTGYPKDTTSKEYRDDGEIFVASSEIELTSVRIAKFEGVKFSKSLYDSLADKNIKLLINIYSGRKSTQDNLLDGGILSDKMSNVKGKRFSIKAKLIYNDD